MILENDHQALHELPFCLMTDFFWWNRLHSKPLPPPGEQVPLLSLLPSHTFTCVCYHWPLMLSVEATRRTANTQCVSTSKKEQLSPTSPQRCGFMFLLFSIWLNPRRSLCFQPAHCWSPSTGCAQTPPRPQITPSLRGDLFHQEDKSAPCLLSGQYGGSGSQMGSTRRFWCSQRRGGSSMHTLQDGGDCPASSNPDSSTPAVLF